MTIALNLYNSIDIDGDIASQVENYCALNEHLVDIIVKGDVIFTDTSSVSYDTYSIATGGN